MRKSSTDCPHCRGTGKIGEPETLGERLLHARAKRGLTLRDAAEITGLSNPFINQLETGRSADCGAIKLAKLADCYHVSIDWLLGREMQNGDK